MESKQTRKRLTALGRAAAAFMGHGRSVKPLPKPPPRCARCDWTRRWCKCAEGFKD